MKFQPKEKKKQKINRNPFFFAKFDSRLSFLFGMGIFFGQFKIKKQKKKHRNEPKSQRSKKNWRKEIFFRKIVSNEEKLLRTK